MLSMQRVKQRKEECNRIFVRHDDHGDVGLSLFPAGAVTKNNADTEYQKGNYQGHMRL